MTQHEVVAYVAEVEGVVARANERERKASTRDLGTWFATVAANWFVLPLMFTPELARALEKELFPIR